MSSPHAYLMVLIDVKPTPMQVRGFMISSDDNPELASSGLRWL